LCTLKNQAQCSAIKSKDHCCTSTSKAQVQMSPASDLFDLTIRVWTLSYKYDYFCRVGQNGIYMVYIRYFWQGNPHTYGHLRYVYIWCTYSIFGREIPIHTVMNGMYIYGVHTVFFAGKSPYIRSYTVCIYMVYIRYFWQGNIRSYAMYIYGSGQPYICGICSWEIVKYFVA
jgi:hypothetical protein